VLQRLIDECPYEWEDVWRAAQQEVEALGAVPHERVVPVDE
jgi:hypothetical protein